jgi:hypothetical protein
LKSRNTSSLGHLAANVQGVGVMLEDKSHNEIGFLILNLGMESFVEPPAGTDFELVVISAGSLPPRDCDYLLKPRTNSLFGVGWGSLGVLESFESFVFRTVYTVIEFYYVLWVGWENGVAHRKGLGRVLKDAWNREKTDEIDLILG